MQSGLDENGVTIRRRLAVGGMAELFLGELSGSDGETRPVVVKRLLPGADAAWRQLFERERQALAAVDSPHVVRLLGGGPEHLLLEFVDGADLRALLAHLGRRGRVLPLGAALALIEGLLRGLADLHAACEPGGRALGLVHRDVSPANLLISRTGEVKLTDLGVVRVSAADHPTVAGLKGTLAYMAPEQLAGQDADARADLYAAGLLIWELLTGMPARPPGAAGLADLLDARTRLPAAPSTIRPDLPPGLDAPVLHALQPDPALRPESASALLGAIGAAAAGAADPASLGAIVGEVEASAGAPERTLAPELSPSPAVAPAVTTGDRALMRAGARGWLVGLLVLAAAVVVALLWARSGGGPGAAVATRAPTAMVEETGGRSAAVGLAQIGGDVGEGAREESADATAAPDTTPEASGGPAPSADAPEAADAGGSEAAEDALPSEEATAAEAPAGERSTPVVATRVEVRPVPGQGPLHARGAGLSGLTPGRTEALGEGAHVLNLVGGAQALPAILRLSQRGERISARVGAPAGRWYQVRCGKTDHGPTPKTLSLRRRLSCTLTAPDGAHLGFELRRLGP